VISSWQHFPMYSIDFSWGTPIKVILHAPGRGGIFVILPRREQDGVEVKRYNKQLYNIKILLFIRSL
jgi:hypothetical protein